MSLLSQKHCNLYISKKVLHVHVKAHERLEIKSTNRGFASPQYHQTHEEWEENLDNDEVE